MKYWNQLEVDAFEYYGDFNKENVAETITSIPILNVFTINCILMDRHEFIDRCVDDIKGLFLKSSKLNSYKLYLLANVEVRDKNSKVEKYKKVWKLLKNKWLIDNFKKGIEIERFIADKLYYSSIAEFNIDDISIALEIISENPGRFTIIASKNNKLISENFTNDIFNIMFRNTDTSFPKIDYFNLSSHLCAFGDIVFRWGDSSEEKTLGLIFRSELLEEF